MARVAPSRVVTLHAKVGGATAVVVVGATEVGGDVVEDAAGTVTVEVVDGSDEEVVETAVVEGLRVVDVRPFWLGVPHPASSIAHVTDSCTHLARFIHKPLPGQSCDEC
jgi:hypothetical protein